MIGLGWLVYVRTVFTVIQLTTNRTAQLIQNVLYAYQRLIAKRGVIHTNSLADNPIA